MLRAPSEICLSNLYVHFVDFSRTQENRKTGKILSMTVENCLFISLGGRGLGDFWRSVSTSNVRIFSSFIEVNKNVYIYIAWHFESHQCAVQSHKVLIYRNFGSI
jgi:hypothetical protein